MNCKTCERQLVSDEVSLNYKLISRECTAFLCLSCMAEYFGVTEEKLNAKIAQFKRQGCLLFAPSSDTAIDTPNSPASLKGDL